MNLLQLAKGGRYQIANVQHCHHGDFEKIKHEETQQTEITENCADK